MKVSALWILALTILIVAGTRAVRAHSHRSESRSSFNSVVTQTNDLVRLRRTAIDSALSPRPEGGLAGRVAQALSRSGLASSVLQSLSPEAETIDKGLVHQRATLTLSGLSLPQVGKFLDAWRSGEPDWVVSGLELSPAGTGAPGADLPLRAVVTMEAVFRDQPRMPTLTPGFQGISR